MTVGSDGNLWLVEAQKIARITPEGRFTEFAVQQPTDGILSGPDSNLWFEVANKNAAMVRMSTHGDIRAFALSRLSGVPAAPIFGPDGNLWFPEHDQNGEAIGKIAKMTLAGQITEFSFPFKVHSLAPASDGDLWFLADHVIGRMTPGGVVMTTFAVETGKITRLTPGPDGNLWFIENDGHVGRITLAGTVSRFAAFEPTEQMIYDITAGPDGNLWFSAQAGKIGRITPSGVVTLFPLPQQEQVGALLAGPDDHIWFIRTDTDMSGVYWWTQIGYITP